MNITTVGVDLAKIVFQTHGVDERGKVGLRRQLKRAQMMSFFRTCRRASSVWRRVRARTSGRASSPSLGIPLSSWRRSSSSLREDNNTMSPMRKRSQRGGGATEHALCSGERTPSSRRFGPHRARPELCGSAHLALCQPDLSGWFSFVVLRKGSGWGDEEDARDSWRTPRRLAGMSRELSVDY